MPITRPVHGKTRTDIVDIGFVGVQMEADPAITNVVENIKHMRARAVNNVYLAMVDLAVQMEQEAQDLAHRLYRSHYDRHPTERYPNEDVAADSIQSHTFRRGDVVGILLQYPPETVMITKDGRRVTYGGILEAEVHGDFAVIQPTWEASYSGIDRILSGSLNRYGDDPVRRKSRSRKR